MTSNIKTEIGRRLKIARSRAGMEVADLTALIPELKYSRYKNYENGLREPDIAITKKIAAALRVPAEWLLTLTDYYPDPTEYELAKSVFEALAAMEPAQRYQAKTIIDVLAATKQDHK